MPTKGDAPALPGARAVARHVRISPMKARRVVNLVRGLPAKEALTVLQFAPQAASEPVYKVLASAIANAENNERLDPDSLLVAEAYVDEGPTLKRFRPRAQGRAYRIRKRTCHITIVVESVPAGRPAAGAAAAATGRGRRRPTSTADAVAPQAPRRRRRTKARRRPTPAKAAKTRPPTTDRGRRPSTTAAESAGEHRAEEAGEEGRQEGRAEGGEGRKAAKKADGDEAEEGTE